MGFGSVFFVATGFHGLHVIVGTLFLLVCLIRLSRARLDLLIILVYLLPFGIGTLSILYDYFCIVEFTDEALYKFGLGYLFIPLTFFNYLKSIKFKLFIEA